MRNAAQGQAQAFHHRAQTATQQAHQASIRRQRDLADERIRKSMRDRQMLAAYAAGERDEADAPAPVLVLSSGPGLRSWITRLALACLFAFLLGAAAAAVDDHFTPHH